MSEIRKDLAIVLPLLGLSLALALGGLAWLGIDGRVPVDMTLEGEVTRSASVLVLWFSPAMALLLLGIGAPVGAWLSRLQERLQAEDESGDAARGFARYRSALRLYMTGFTVVLVSMQLFALARAAGVARPLGLDRFDMVRLLFVVCGFLFIFIGDVTPKVPYVPTPWIDAARHYRGGRFTGWVFVLGGAAVCLAAAAAPVELLQSIIGALIWAMIGLPLVRYAMLALACRREVGRSGCGPS